MITQQDEFGQSETNKEYSFEVITGVDVIAQRRDPYGHFHLKQEKGKLPSKYADGSYTSLFEVERAIKEYKNELTKDRPQSKTQLAIEDRSQKASTSL